MSGRVPPDSTIDLSARREAQAQNIREAAEAMLELNIARKNMLIYPETHELVQRILQRAGTALRKSVERFEPLTVAVLQEQLTIGGHPLEARGAALRDLAIALRQRGIASVTFSKNFGEAEWIGFMKLLALDPQEIQRQGGIQIAAADLLFSGIILHAVDYSKLEVTEEQEIHRASNTPSSESTWSLFVSHLVSGRLAAGGDPGRIVTQISDPAEMAALLNADPAAPQQALDYYRYLVAEYLQKEEREAVYPTDWENFRLLMQELKPEWQQQFVESALDQCTRHEHSPRLAEVMRGLNGDLIAQMLRQANAQGRSISPSLMAFIRKMGFVVEGLDPAGASLSRQESSEDLKVLLEREEFDKFVDEDYAGVLNKMSGPIPEDAAAGAWELLKTEIDQAAGEAGVARHMALALTALMTASSTVEEYRDWARQLTFLLDDLLAVHAYEALIQIRDDLLVHRRNQENPEKIKISGLVLDHFTTPSFLAPAVEAVLQSATGEDLQALSLLECLGESAVPEALEGWGGHALYNPENPLMRLFGRHPRLAAEEALERLQDPRPAVVCRMLEVLRRFGSPEDAEEAKELLGHAVEEVRMEALATLLHFRNGRGLETAREMMLGVWSAAAHKAIQMCGFYRVREAIPILLAMVERPGPLAADMERREAALRALGRIGDPECLSSLSRIARRRWSLARKPLLHLKRAVFESLEGYPFEAIEDLLHAGLRQKDRAIAGMCERLLKKGRAPQAGEHR